MAHRKLRFVSILFGAVVLARLGLIGSAFASDPLAGDAYAPAPNSTLVFLYDFYHNDDKYGGQLGDPSGPDAKQGTQVTANVVLARVLHSFLLDNYNAGA
jgi:hypothetical protein